MMTAGIINSKILNYNKRIIIKKPITHLGTQMLENEFKFINHAPVLKKICIDINYTENPCIIMNYKGESLQSKLMNNTLDMPLSQFLKSFASATMQLSGIIHGDIKPDNILVCNNELFFIDYGCSKIIPGEAIAYTKKYADDNLLNDGVLEFSSDRFAFAKVLQKVFLYYLVNCKDIDIEIDAVKDCTEIIVQKSHIMSWKDIRNLINKTCQYYYNSIDITNRISFINSSFGYQITRGKIITMGVATGSYLES